MARGPGGHHIHITNQYSKAIESENTFSSATYHFCNFYIVKTNQSGFSYSVGHYKLETLSPFTQYRIVSK